MSGISPIFTAHAQKEHISISGQISLKYLKFRRVVSYSNCLRQRLCAILTINGFCNATFRNLAPTRIGVNLSTYSRQLNYIKFIL